MSRARPSDFEGPLVSVIIPAYNRKAYVQEAIDSVLAQTYPHYEIIVIDDGSTDGTGEALAARYGDRINYHWQENRGESAARNWGIQMARGQYIALLDSDDLWYPNKLSTQVKWIVDRPEVGILSCLGETIDSSGRALPGMLLGLKAIGLDDFYEALYRENILGGGGSQVILSREAIDHVIGFDESIRYGEDWELWLRIAAIAAIDCVPEVLCRIRIHPGGQWRFPKPERTTKHLNDHLKIIHNGYSIWPDKPPHAEMVRDRKIAEQYARAAVDYFAFNEPELGQGALSQAAEFDSEIWANLGSFKPIVFQLACRLEENKKYPPGNGIPVVMRIVQQLSVADAIHFHDPVAKADQILLELGYYFSARGERRRALRYLSMANRMNPQYIRDRGVQLELIKITLGSSTAQKMRKTYHDLRDKIGFTV